jgi:hypothetical protein
MISLLIEQAFFKLFDDVVIISVETQLIEIIFSVEQQARRSTTVRNTLVHGTRHC